MFRPAFGGTALYDNCISQFTDRIPAWGQSWRPDPPDLHVLSAQVNVKLLNIMGVMSNLWTFAACSIGRVSRTKEGAAKESVH
jgi:hypothetical protein